MYLQEVVEVAIGLIFAWLLLSIAILQVQEIVANWTSRRSTDLYGAIEKMLDDPKVLEEFYRHPLIESLKTPPNGVSDWFKKRFSKVKLQPKNPSYIPSETFARALFDIVTKAGTRDSPITSIFTAFQNEVKKLKEGDQKTANDLVAHLVNLGQRHAGTQIIKLKEYLRKEMISKLTEFEMVGATDAKSDQPLAIIANELKALVQGDRADDLALLLRGTEPYLDQVRKGVVTHGSKRLGDALNSLLAGAEEYANTTDKAIAIGRRNVEAWFDNSMERLSGGYKRWAQIWAFGIAFIIAILFNIDSIHIARELWRNPAMRQASATYIDNFVKEKTQDGSALSDVDLQIINTQIQKLAYPVGWDEVTAQLASEISKKSSGFSLFLDWLWFCLGKLAGWVITAGAAMQGAPFWFDTLKKLVNVRSTGANPIEKPKESTSDKER